MVRNRIYWLLCLFLLSSLALAACGSPPAAEEPAQEAAEAEPEAEDPEEEAAESEPEAEAPEEEMESSEEAAAEAEPEAEAPEEETEASEGEAASGDDTLTFGMVLVGPINDGGWSQAHYEGALYAEERAAGTEFIHIDKVNPADRPNVQVEQVVDELVDQGAEVIITNSDDFKDGTRQAAMNHPDVIFIHASGDDVLTGQAPPNLGNIMGQMEYGKMMAGCAAALHTENGQLAYLGPLVNDETRRLVNSAYLGAQYCYNNLRAEQPTPELSFEVIWIGFWFNIPGVTLDPTQVANDFINSGADVIISGIDTTEALIEANKATEAGTPIAAVPYDFEGACEQAPDVCLGVPYFNWGPAYLELLEAAQTDTWEQSWDWIGPDWENINNKDTSAIGFLKGDGLAAEEGEQLDTFIAGLADGSINLWTGPLTFQDGTVFLEEGATASDEQIWYMPQLLEGIEGTSGE